MNAPSTNKRAARTGAPHAAGNGPAAVSRAAQVLKNFHEEGALGRAYDLRLMKRLWPFVRPYRKLFWASLVITLFTAGGALLRPLVMLRTIDAGVMRGDEAVLIPVQIDLLEHPAAHGSRAATQVVKT